MIETKYNIGDTVWFARYNQSNERAMCPDCGGTGRIRCIMHDETAVSVECRECQVGYDPPTGFVTVYGYFPQVEPFVITGAEVGPKGVTRYRSHHYNVEADELFSTEAEAEIAALRIVEEAKQHQREQLARKEKDTRSWAWNAAYHRNCIRRAQKDIEYHTAKLNVAAIKAKEGPKP